MLDNLVGVPVLYNAESFVDFEIMKYYARRMDDNFYNENQHQHPLIIQPQLFNVATVCKMLSISRSTFYELVKDGRLPVYKLGTMTLVTSLAIQHFVQAAHDGSVSGRSGSDEGDS